MSEETGPPMGKEQAKIVDTARRKSRVFLEELSDEIRQPLTDFEFEQEGGQEVQPEEEIPAPEAETSEFQEGQTATNPQTGEKLIFRNGQWGAL